MTHILRIPFATAQSTPQFLNSIARVAEDPITSALPRAAWSVPGEINFNITALSLKTPAQLEAAIQLLKDMGASFQTKREPLVVAVHGLYKDYDPRDTKSLKCYILETRPFLEDFRHRVRATFLAKGFVSHGRHLRKPTPINVKIMSTGYLRSDTPTKSIQDKDSNWFRTPMFDASDVFLQYENFPWTKEFSLERMCISESGLKDVWKGGKVIRTDYRDIACVPLPGAPARDLDVDRRDETYTVAFKKLKRNFPWTPLRIPSTPMPH